MSDSVCAADAAFPPAPSPDQGPEPGRRVADWVAEQILGRIAKGDLSPGQRLPGERQLAEQLGVSRVSVRAALQRLKTQGFLDAVQGGGTRVVSSAGAMDAALTAMVRTTLDNLYDLVEIRMALETWAARRAAERATPEQISALDQIMQALAAPSSHGRRAPHDMDFHLEIARAAGSPVYLHIFSTIRDILDRMMAADDLEAVSHGCKDLILDHHRAILEAIRNRDPDRAAAAVAGHLDWVLRRYHELRDRDSNV